MENSTPLQFGIMLNGYSMQYWQRVCCLKLIESGLAECKILIFNDQKEERKRLIPKLLTFISHKPLYHLYLRFLCRTPSRHNTDCSDILAGISQIRCKTTKKGKYSEYFKNEDLDSIRSYDLDFILRFGFNIIRGEILKVPKYGVWSFHHGDELTYRGGPTGFWEVYNREKVNGAILQRLTDTIDAGIVLKKGHFEVILHSYPAHIDQLLLQTTHWPLSVCKDILAGCAGYFWNEPSASRVKINRIPGNAKMIIFLLNQAVNKISFHYKDLFSEEQWNVGAIQQPIKEIIENQIIEKKVTWLPLKKRHLFQADPFVIFQSNKYIILYESFDYKTGIGIICRTTFEPATGFSPPVVIQSEKYHLSYPSVFQHDGLIYLIPEQCETDKVSLFRLEPPDYKPLYIRDLLTGIKAVDTTLFEFEGKIWMLFTIQDDHSNLNLYAYYADNLENEFKPHRNNPVKTDISSARPAGNIFRTGNQYFRPSQDSSLRYGGSLKLNRIKVLTPDQFVEEEMIHFQPFIDSPYPKGLHTLNSAGNLTVIDGKRLCFVWPSFRRKLKMKLTSKFS